MNQAKSLYAFSLASYATSFFLPTFAIVVAGKSEYELGFSAFYICMLNAWDFAGSLPFVVWLANPVMWVGAVLFLMGKGRATCFAAGIALLLAIPFAFRDLILVGYYVWLASMGLLFAAGAALSE